MSRWKIFIVCLSIACFAIVALLTINIRSKMAEKPILGESTTHISAGKTPVNPNKQGWTELMEAVSNGDLAEVNALLNKGVNMNAKYNDDSTALMIAAYKGNLEIVKALVNCSADINMQSKNGGTALSMAVLWGHIDVGRFLIEKGAKDNNALFMAIEQGYTSIVDGLLKSSIDVNNTKNKMGISPIMIAIEMGHAAIVKTLLEKGADANTRGNGNITPLMVAAANGQSDVAKILLDNGADANIRDEDGITALMNAVEKGDITTVQLLLAHGADLYVKDQRGRSPISLTDTLTGKQKRSIKRLLAAASKPLSIKPDATFQFATISKAVNDVASTTTFNDFKNKNHEMILHKFHENYEDLTDYDNIVYYYRDWMFDEIPDEVAEDTSKLWYQFEFHTWCYETVVESNGIETVNLFYTGVAFEKVDPKVQRAVVINKKADIKLDGVVSHLLKLGLKQKPLPIKNDSKKDNLKNLVAYFDDDKVIAHVFSNQDYITIMIDNKTFRENGRLLEESGKQGKAFQKDNRFEEDIKEAANELNEPGIINSLKAIPKIKTSDLNAGIENVRKLSSVLEKILKDNKIPKTAVPAVLFILSTYCPSEITIENKPSKYKLESLKNADSLGMKYKECANIESSKGTYTGYCYTFSLLNEIIKKYPGTKWSERAMVQLVWNEFGECDDYNHYCETFAKVIKTLSEFLPKCKDEKATCDLTFQLGAAYETYWTLSKEGMSSEDFIENEAKELQSIETARDKAIECYKKVLTLDKEGIYKKHIGNSIPMLYLNISTGHTFFFSIWE
jgi:ankyrin repeat protein